MLRQPREGTTLLEFYRELMSCSPIVDGKLLTVTVPAGVTLVTPEHGLGRMPRGNILCGSTIALASDVRLGMPNPTSVGVVVTPPPATDATVLVWVF